VADSEQAEFAYQRATLARRQAQRNYDLTRVVAPFAGVVTARSARPGRLVAPGDSLFRVAALAPLRASVRVPEGGARGITTGSRAEVDGLDGVVARATVFRVSPTIDAASGTREVVIELAPGSGLRSGTGVSIRLGTERRRVVAVPPGAITEQGYVLVWANGRTVLRAVTRGQRLSDGRVEVASGLSAGEQVVRDPK
jgi:RND family efflux transporter MFP subunit